jgi:hypothetical protein
VPASRPGAVAVFAVSTGNHQQQAAEPPETLAFPRATDQKQRENSDGREKQQKQQMPASDRRRQQHGRHLIGNLNTA